MTAAADPAGRVRESFDRMSALRTLGATLRQVAPGEVTIALPMAPHILQQHGFVHAGVLATIADTACGFAALTLMPAESAVLTTEFKINLLTPARADSFEAVARVIRAGRRLHVATADVFGITGDDRRHVAMMIASLMAIEPAAGLRD